MQKFFLDIPAGAIKRNQMLQEWIQNGYAAVKYPRSRGYDRVLLQHINAEELYDLVETVTFQESVHWILQEEGRYYRMLLEPGDYAQFRRQVKHRMEKREPQMRTLIRRDMEQILPGTITFNVHGYLRFAAGKLKQVQKQLMEEEYQRLEDELEQEEFIELLRFFVSVQTPLMEEARLSIYQNRFTLTDEWGNDLRRIYLESLLDEEIASISDNDLIMSILITLLPRKICLTVQEPPESREFLFLLQQVFGSRIVVSP